ncbi:hypothetical protein AURDEDRAFT_124835 [Auricularia subglabra TFB-10046 SS5]|nr:hypothetical protein AURDEDRAFT_124835 [Auricularia subglabra TFB-10046 SS5]
MSQKPADIGLVLGRINESYTHWRGELHAAAKELEPDARSALTFVLQGAWIERSAVAAPEAFIAARHALVVLANALVRILDNLATAGDPKEDDAALKVYGESTTLLCDTFRTFVSAAMHLSRASGSAAPQPDPAVSTASPSAADASGNAPVPNPPAPVLPPLPTVEEELILVDGEFPDIATARSQSKKRPRADDDDTDERPQKVPRIDPHADKLLTTVELAKFEDIVKILTVMRQGLGDAYAKGAMATVATGYDQIEIVRDARQCKVIADYALQMQRGIHQRIVRDAWWRRLCVALGVVVSEQPGVQLRGTLPAPADIGLVLGRINKSYAHWRGELHAAAKELEPDARSALVLVLQGAWIERSAVAAPEAFIAARHALVVLANALVRILDTLATAGDPKGDDAALKVYGESTSLLCETFRTFVSAAMHLSRAAGSAAPQPDPAVSTTSPSAGDASSNAPVPNPPAPVLPPLPTVEEVLILVDGEFPDIATARSQSKKRPRADDDDNDERPQKVPRIDPHADKLLTTVELAKFEDIVKILTVMRQGLGDTYAQGALAQTTPSEINPLDTEYVSRLLEKLSLALRPEPSV